jgi:hypothetical protein
MEAVLCGSRYTKRVQPLPRRLSTSHFTVCPSLSSFQCLKSQFPRFRLQPVRDPSTDAEIGATTLSFRIPQATPSGDYLVRIEHIALHGASSPGGAQPYMSCGQITVTNGGNGNPGPLVSFPGAYSPTDPGLLINVYWPVPTNYTIPGPRIWTG